MTHAGVVSAGAGADLVTRPAQACQGRQQISLTSM